MNSGAWGRDSSRPVRGNEKVIVVPVVVPVKFLVAVSSILGRRGALHRILGGRLIMRRSEYYTGGGQPQRRRKEREICISRRGLGRSPGTRWLTMI